MEFLYFPYVLTDSHFFVSIKNNRRNAYEIVNLPTQKIMNLSCKKG